MNPPYIFINKKIWSEFTPEQMEKYENDVFLHYRENGFPFFNLTDEQCHEKFKKLKWFDTKRLVIGDELNQVMLGLDVANTFMPHLWNVKSRNFRSPLETFYDDEMLRKAIKKRIKLGDNMSDAGMRKALSWTNGTHKVSNFRPTVAKFIYDNYSGDGKVLDFSCGFGGRLLGALSSDRVVSYHGTDPCGNTFRALCGMNKFFNSGLKDVLIEDKPFEDLVLTEKYDLAFSSPPYFDTERYSYEPTQSWMRYETKESWRYGFLFPLIQKCYKHLKYEGRLVINVANVKSYQNLEDDVIQIAHASGFVLDYTWKMRLSSLMGSGFKYEPIFVFIKI